MERDTNLYGESHNDMDSNSLSNKENTFKIGDYVKDKAGKEKYTGIIFGFSNDTPYWPIILNLKTLETSKAIHSTYLYKDEVPEEDKLIYDILKINNYSLNIFDYLQTLVKLEEHYGQLVWTNPLMDRLRKNLCLCLNCKSLNECTTAKELYEICKRDDIAFSMTRCKKYNG